MIKNYPRCFTTQCDGNGVKVYINNDVYDCKSNNKKINLGNGEYFYCPKDITTFCAY